MFVSVGPGRDCFHPRGSARRLSSQGQVLAAVFIPGHSGGDSVGAQPVRHSGSGCGSGRTVLTTHWPWGQPHLGGVLLHADLAYTAIIFLYTTVRYSKGDVINILVLLGPSTTFSTPPTFYMKIPNRVGKNCVVST